MLGISEDQLQRKFICGKHFPDKAYKNLSRKTLNHDATPIDFRSVSSCSSINSSHHGPSSSPCMDRSNITSKYDRNDSSLLAKTPPICKRSAYSPKSSPGETPKLAAIIDMPTPNTSPSVRRAIIRDLTECTPRKKKLRQQISQQQLMISRQKGDIRRKKAYIKRIKAAKARNKASFRPSFLLNNHTFPSLASKTMCEMQFKMKKRKWTAAERELALSIYHKSPAAYEKMLQKGIILPALSTVRSWIGRSKFLPGFNAFFWENLKKKFEGEDEKMTSCTVMFDELSIKDCLEYNPHLDFIEGFEDLGTLGRTKERAHSAMVFMVRGLYSPWKVPVAYFLSKKAVKKDQLKSLIEATIQHVQKAGLNPKVMVCDQGTNNRSALKALKISKDRPYIEINNHIIYCIYDVPHLFKCLRNNLLNGNYVQGDKTISIRHIRRAYFIDQKSSRSSSLPKLKVSHLYPNPFEKLSVKRALQLLSHSVAATIPIRTCVDTGEMNSAALDTAEFLEIVNNYSMH